MRKMVALLAGLLVTLTAGMAMAFTLPTYSDFQWSNQPFWTNTDLTTSVDGNANFQLTFEGFSPASRDADFGLFAVDNVNNPTTVTQYFQVFDRTDEPTPIPTKTVTFRDIGGNIEVSLDQSNWTAFSSSFGFYFDFIDTATTNPAAPQTYYSYFALDTDANGLRNVFTATDSDKQVLIYLDRFAGANGMTEGPVMTVYANDLAPVPEPGTMVLLGFGMLGLAIYGKRRMNNNQA